MKPLLAACLLAVPALARAESRPLHDFLSVALSPDAQHIASVEGDVPPGGGPPDIRTLVIRGGDGSNAVTVPLACGVQPECTPSDLAWTPDSLHLAFVLRTPGSHAHDIYLADPAGGAPVKLLGFDGTLGGLRYGPDGALAVLATEGAQKETGAVEAGAAQVGELGADVHEQRIATLQDGALRFASPPDLFVYEYDWRPGGQGFVATAAPGDGDNHWWVAKLYAFTAAGEAKVLYAPADPRLQLAQPRVSPDGSHASFIGGIMSDFGSTGGDAFVLGLAGGQEPANVTPGWQASVTSLAWSCDGQTLRAALLASENTQIVNLSTKARPEPLATAFSGQERLEADQEPISGSCKANQTATIRQSFTKPPEIAVGPVGEWQDVTHANAGHSVPGLVRSLSWQRDGFQVQGWLLLPQSASGSAKLPMVTLVHGGPAAAYEPRFVGTGTIRSLLEKDYAVFLPNPRGSFGQGEAFTQANVRDLGYGDLGDILAGIDAAEAAAPIDEARLGIAGWSYGGFMTMFAVTQTDRFHAAFAGAGIANWQSYYGQNGIDAWMIPYFGASVYQDPGVYARSAPISFITHVRTPTFAVVGERDVECPAPQTMEFWHALAALGVPTGAVIYPGDGHWIRNPDHVADISRRMVGWFDTYLRP